MVNFVSLHNQSHYSILDSLISPKQLLDRALELGQPAVALTDHGTLAGTWEAFTYSKKIGIKLIIGCECYFVNNTKDENNKLRHIILLAKNAIGYRNLLTLNKKGFDQGIFFGKKIYSTLDWKLLQQYSEGLICLTACGNGIVSQLLMNKNFDEANQTIIKLKEIFGDNLALEVQPNNMKRFANHYNDEIDQQFLNRRLIELGKIHNVKVVAACNSHYIADATTNKTQANVHDVFLAIGSHQPIHSNFRIKYNVPDFYLKSGEEVKAFFSRNYGEDLAQQLCDNSIYFSDLCENPEWIDPKFSNPSGKELPIFPVKDEPDYSEFLMWLNNQNDDLKKLKEDQSYLRYKCEKLFEIRIKNLTNENRKEYQDRLLEEYNVLEFHGFSSYMLLVADFLTWARNHNIAVGEGRGSVGGSLVAFLLNIHQADPLQYNLIFARFHNISKSAMPDIDSDIAPSGREKVQNYLRQKYGEDHVAHVSNFNTITPKVFIKDVARACELGGSKEQAIVIGNDVAGIVPAELNNIDEAVARIPLFGEYCKKYPEFIKYKSICELPRAASTHAGGIVVAARSLTGLVPIRKDKDGTLSLEYDKDKAEENGLVKIDTLGLSTLDLFETTYKLIELNGKQPPPKNLDYDVYDKPTYDLISKGNTFCVFQLGTSAGTINLCQQIKPQNIEDLANINALARPSAAEIRSDFIKAKNGTKAFTLLHPKLKRAFGTTYGFGLYEECLMYLAQDIAGWNLNEADKLRKLTKEKGKNPKKVQQWRQEFIDGSVKNNINKEIAKRIWDEVVVPFGGYGFNKSHAVLYSMLSYKAAYLKANFPIEFLTANLMAESSSASPDARGNIDKIKKELRANKVKILPPNINTSQLSYIIQDSNKLLTGLDALKFVGDDAIKDIIEKRPFNNFFDFMVRVDSKKVRANTIQALAAVGAMDSFKISRKLIFLYCSDYRKKLQVWLKKHDPKTETFTYPWPTELEWKLSELYALEQYYIGEAFVCKPIEAYGKFLKDSHITIYEIKKAKDKTKLYPIKVILREFFEFKVKKEGSKLYGQSMVKAIIEDRNGDQCSCTIFPEGWVNLQQKMKQFKIKFEPGIALSFAGIVNHYEGEVGIIFENLFSVEDIPALPSDLKAKKINLKEAKDKQQDLFENPLIKKDLFEKIEDILYDDGLIDLDNAVDED